MGGRGASFVNYNGDVNISIEDTLNEDVETLKQTKIVKQLKKRNVIVMASTDNIPDEILTPNLKTINKILSKTKLYPYMENQKLLVRTERMSNYRIEACFKCNNYLFFQPQLIYNKVINNKTAESVNKCVEEQVKMKYWSKSDKQNYINHTISHEMGHLVQRIITEKYAVQHNEIKKRLQDARKYDTLIASKVKKEILEIAKNQFNSKQIKISNYGEQSPFEFFAETYAEVVCCDKPSALAKAMEIYLRRIK